MQCLDRRREELKELGELFTRADGSRRRSPCRVRSGRAPRSSSAPPPACTRSPSPAVGSKAAPPPSRSSTARARSAIRRWLPRPNSLEVVGSLIDLGAVELLSGRLDEAEKRVRRAWEIQARVAPYHPGRR